MPPERAPGAPAEGRGDGDVRGRRRRAVFPPGPVVWFTARPDDRVVGLVPARGPHRVGPADDPPGAGRGAPGPRLPARRRGALALLRRGERAGQPGGERADRPRAAPRGGGLDAAAQLRGEPRGVVRDPEGRRGPVPDQPRLPGRLPLVGRQPAALAVPGDRLRPPRPPRGRGARAPVARARDRSRGGRAVGPGAARAPRAPRGPDGRARRRARRRGRLDRRRADHVHVRHDRAARRGRSSSTPPTTSRAAPTSRSAGSRRRTRSSRACPCSTRTPRSWPPTRR